MQSKFTKNELKEIDTLDAQLSDHLPIIHQEVFFWNIMMQGNLRTNGTGFNNGFGLIETNRHYRARLEKIAKFIATTQYQNPSIEVIALCEGPNQPKDIQYFYHALTQYQWMQRFISDDIFYQPNKKITEQWGLLMLVDKSYTVDSINYPVDKEIQSKLENRYGLWKLAKKNQERYIALAHFPFAGDEHKKEKTELSYIGKKYCEFVDSSLKQYASKELLFCADFNLNPYLISHWKDRVLDNIPSHNSFLLMDKNIKKFVTVDGVLLSTIAKQKKICSSSEVGLFGRLKRERNLMLASHKQITEPRSIEVVAKP